MLKSDFDIENNISIISDTQLEEVEKRRVEYLSENAKISSWKDMRKRIESRHDI